MIKKIFAAVMFLLLCSYCSAQQSKASKKELADTAWARAGCGSDDIRFNVNLDNNQHPVPQAEAGKAMVYIFEEDNTRGGSTTRVGLDGKWVGANEHGSYLLFSIQPGTHRLCSNWQGNSKIGAALDVTTEAGKTYYFRASITSFDAVDLFALKPVEEAEAQFLIATHYQSIFRIKGEDD